MPTTATDVGLLALRLGVGGTLFAHGAQKLFGWFGGHGLAGTGAFFDSVGFTPGHTTAMAAGIAEAGGGALIALGLGTPAAGAAVAGNMTVAASTHVPNGFFATEGGLEYPAILALTGATLALSGPGTLSLDHALGHTFNRPWMRAVALVSVVPAVTSVILARRKAVAATAAAEPTPGEPTGAGADDGGAATTA